MVYRQVKIRFLIDIGCDLNLFSFILDVPTGTILLYSGNAATLVKVDPIWLFCDGSAVSRTKYSALFLVIGTFYGGGNGIDTFNIPDLRNRFPWGSSGPGNTTFLSGGSATHMLTTAQLPSHIVIIQALWVPQPMEHMPIQFRKHHIVMVDGPTMNGLLALLPMLPVEVLSGHTVTAIIIDIQSMLIMQILLCRMVVAITIL